MQRYKFYLLKTLTYKSDIATATLDSTTGLHFAEGMARITTDTGTSMVIDLQRHRTTRAMRIGMLSNGSYGGEIMNANRNLAVVYPCHGYEVPTSPELPDDASAADVNALLDRIYPLATQI